MIITKYWFIERTLDLYREKLEEALKDMPPAAAEYEYLEVLESQNLIVRGR